MKNKHQQEDYLPNLPIVHEHVLEEIKKDTSLSWYHNIDMGGYVTPGRVNTKLWNATAHFLERNRNLIEGNRVLELGAADGLWSCWLKKLGASKIAGVDFREYKTYRKVIELFDLPVDYYPGLISTETPTKVKGSFSCVVSFGLLYHVHDILTTLVMYHKYLSEGGILFLETAVVEDEYPALYYTADGLILPEKANNQFIPTTGFLKKILVDKLGMELQEEQFLSWGKVKGKSTEWGRVLLRFKKTNPPNLSMYSSVARSLGM